MFDQISSSHIPPHPSLPSGVIADGFMKRMNQVTRLLATSEQGLSERVTHDLRVAIRRCRSVAYGVKGLDPEGPWKQMSKELRRVFRTLGHLRDLHVMQSWVEKLGKASDPVRLKVTAILRKREQDNLIKIREALARFDHDSWENWCGKLPDRLQEALASHPVLINMALERLHDFLSIHQEMLATDLEEIWHKARVALKRFRYTVENFLPEQHLEWQSDLEALQDVLGEIHDLDVLSSFLNSLSPLFEPIDRVRWGKKIQKERAQRLEEYLARTVGENGPLDVWRENLQTLQGGRSSGARTAISPVVSTVHLTQPARAGKLVVSNTKGV